MYNTPIEMIRRGGVYVRYDGLRRRDGLGLDAGAVAQQAGSMAASFAVRTGTTMAITSLTSGAAAGSMLAAIGSMAGPIGAIIGVVVSFIMSMFGPDPKKPVFGLTIIVPEAVQPTVALMLDYLVKPMFDWQEAHGLKKEQQAAAIQSLLAKLNAPPRGAIVITSGGLPEAVKSAKNLDFNAISNKTATIGAPFREVLSKVTDPQIRQALLNYPLPFAGRVKNYYYNLDKQKNPKAKAVQGDYDQFKITGGEKLSKSLEKGFEAIARKLNEAFIATVGVDVVQGGKVVNGELATRAFKPTASSAITNAVSQLTETPTGWLVLAGGAYLLFSKG